MLEKINHTLQSWLIGFNVPEAAAALIAAVALVLAGIALAVIAYRLVLKFFSGVGTRLTASGHPALRQSLENSRLIRRLAHFVPIIILNAVFGSSFATGFDGYSFGRTVIHLYLLITVTGVVMAGLEIVGAAAQKARWSSSFPVHGFIQAIKLVIVLLAIIMGLSTLLGRSPTYVLSGIGALTAILMLVFKDTILGFTAGIVLSANRMVSIGDWIEMPSMDADGDVIEVSLTTVKVRNWDKTITSIPAYALVSQSFRNWQGMFDTGGRRIKRALLLDMQTIRFATERQIEHWRKIAVLKPYLHSKLSEIE
jgi:miniconductance mechanosensitive channel